jgi:hypothetical protein
MPWRGPLRVVEKNDLGSHYTLINLITNKYETVHVKHLAPFDYDPRHTDPREVALRQQNEWDVEQILEMKGHFRLKKNLMFKVRWQGWTEDNDTWEPWSNLRNNEVLHQWMTTHGFAKHIPKKFEDLGVTTDYLLLLEERHDINNYGRSL